MKIYFSATLTENDELRGYYSQIIEELKELGHEVLQYGSEKLSPKELVSRTDQEIEKTYKTLDRLLKQADIIVAEISEPSVGIGYEIAEAVSQKKPVLALTHSSSEFQPLATLEGNKSKYVEYIKYEKDETKDILENFISNAKTKMDTKFILIISPEIDKYLEWASDERRMHKAQIVRGAIEDKIEEDKEYQDFLEEQGIAT